MSMSFDSHSNSSPVESPQRIATEQEEPQEQGEIGSLFKRYNYATTTSITMVIPRRCHSFPISFSPTKEKNQAITDISFPTWWLFLIVQRRRVCVRESIDDGRNSFEVTASFRRIEISSSSNLTCNEE
eukprot:924595_1